MDGISPCMSCRGIPCQCGNTLMTVKGMPKYEQLPPGIYETLYGEVVERYTELKRETDAVRARAREGSSTRGPHLAMHARGVAREFRDSGTQGARRRVRTEGRPMSIYTEIQEERARQDAKWGEQNHPSVDPILEARGNLERLCEEYEIPTETRAKFLCDNEHKQGRGSYASIAVEELSESVCAGGDGKRRGELVQLAAVVVGWIEAIDRRASKA